MLRTSLLLFVLLGATPALAQGKAQLDAVSIHLFLATSGTLSPDVTTIKGFGARNFSVQGEGLADNERFYAALIKLRFTSKGEVFAQGPQAQVVVTDRWKKRVVKRERIADLYIGSHGVTHVPVYLPDAACGPFEIVVTGGGRKIVKQLEATCGE
jgi:hypothetical protein